LRQEFSGIQSGDEAVETGKKGRFGLASEYPAPGTEYPLSGFIALGA
jgi:hypothetical protein